MLQRKLACPEERLICLETSAPWVRRFFPRTRTSPSSGVRRLHMTESRVVLPAPLGPRIPQKAPSGMLRSTPFSASFFLFLSHPDTKAFRSPLASTASFKDKPLYGY